MKHDTEFLLVLVCAAGEPRLCASCHMDPTTGTKGEPDPETASAVYKWVAGASDLFRFSSNTDQLDIEPSDL